MKVGLSLAALLLLPLWLFLSLILALLGFFVPKSPQLNHSDEVQGKATVCRLLFEKGHLNAEEYEFEHQVVALMYTRATFIGYCFIMAPVIYILKTSSIIDRLMKTLVRLWISTHKQKSDNRVSFLRDSLRLLVTRVAHHCGGLLMLLSRS